jgi:hypothetical protein
MILEVEQSHYMRCIQLSINIHIIYIVYMYIIYIAVTGHVAFGGGTNIAPLFLNLALEGGERSASRPGRVLIPGKGMSVSADS